MNSLDFKILNIILDKYIQYIDETIFEFADEVGVSASKLTQLCKKMGMSGYKELRYAYQDVANPSKVKAFGILLNLKLLEEQFIELESKDVNYQTLMSEYELINELYTNAISGDDSPLMQRLRTSLKLIVNYYECLSQTETEEYYLNFVSLVVKEIQNLREYK